MKRIRKGIVSLILIAVTLFIVLQLYYLLQIVLWSQYDPTSTRFMREQLSVLQEKNPKARLQFEWVPYERISVHLKRAVVAAEDASFTEHDGIDWNALQDAYQKNLKKGQVVRGGSTITQQLAKNLFLSGERSYFRKGQEAIITYMLEMVLDKRRILEIYLNVAEWGQGVFGAQAAARHYYGQSAASLGMGQSARLAAMLPQPRYYDRHRDSTYLNNRAARIQGWMNSVVVPAK
jgi:monofunctional biosynthetic peptidoglycan transglycosylase